MPRRCLGSFWFLLGPSPSESFTIWSEESQPPGGLGLGRREGSLNARGFAGVWYGCCRGARRAGMCRLRIPRTQEGI
ncbi:hypothetical protein BDP81DRAFT_420041 [Colletotrichum phormii]|uniref:Secreted protein n=1 Tax=Colletotrichum phormii TaxID=359342 RepID=A0AAJ0EIJ5_9PEZI|nr:uncharacterized protein BDP81DRAFT_420041 [Colletotrichum phormii]KAK1640433.1 hypothetical protein BDP81DRAFT_420041 [Colletotrichum phormii]